jgi:hypothetical protein
MLVYRSSCDFEIWSSLLCPVSILIVLVCMICRSAIIVLLVSHSMLPSYIYLSFSSSHVQLSTFSLVCLPLFTHPLAVAVFYLYFSPTVFSKAEAADLEEEEEKEEEQGKD